MDDVSLMWQDGMIGKVKIEKKFQHIFVDQGRTLDVLAELFTSYNIFFLPSVYTFRQSKTGECVKV